MECHYFGPYGVLSGFLYSVKGQKLASPFLWSLWASVGAGGHGLCRNWLSFIGFEFWPRIVVATVSKTGFVEADSNRYSVPSRYSGQSVTVALYQTLFLSLFDLMARIEKATSLYNAIDFYAKVPVLCLDEVGYWMVKQKRRESTYSCFRHSGWKWILFFGAQECALIPFGYIVHI